MEAPFVTSDPRGKAETLLAAINEIATKIESDPGIHPAFHADIVAILTATVSICGLLASSRYSIDGVTAQAGQLLQALSSVITHAATARQSVAGWMVRRENTFDYLPEVTDEPTARKRAEEFTRVTGMTWLAVLVVMVENDVNRPTAGSPSA